MARNTANVQVNVINEAQSVSPPPLGIAYVIGPTERGIPNDPSALVSSVSQFNRLFGEIVNDFVLECHQAIHGGASLRVCKAVDAAAKPASILLDWAAAGGSAPVVTLYSKGYGAYYNDKDNFMVDIYPPTNGLAGYFNLGLHDWGAGIMELFTDLKPPSTATPVDQQTWAKEITSTSRLVTVELNAATAVTGAVTLQEGLAMAGGADSGPLTVLIYKGDEVDREGFHAFDEYDDGNVMAAPSHGLGLSEMFLIAKPYAELRKDLIFIDHVPINMKGSPAIIAELKKLTTSKYYMALVGGIKVLDPILGGVKHMEGTGMVLGTIATSQGLYGPWYSPTAFTRGVLGGAIGVVHNFGAPIAMKERQSIAVVGGSCIVNKTNTVMFWDAYTLAKPDSPEKFFSVVQLELYMIKALRPMLENYLGEPNAPDTWERIYYTVLPFLESLVAKLALYSYKWDGDQFATSLDNLQINDPTEVGQGIYRIQLQIKTVVPIVEIVLNIILTETSVEFE